MPWHFTHGTSSAAAPQLPDLEFESEKKSMIQADMDDNASARRHLTDISVLLQAELNADATRTAGGGSGYGGDYGGSETIKGLFNSSHFGRVSLVVGLSSTLL